MQYGSLSGPFAPVVDGVILPDTPVNLRNAKRQMKVKVLAGLTKDEGAYYACMLLLSHVFMYSNLFCDDLFAVHCTNTSDCLTKQ